MYRLALHHPKTPRLAKVCFWLAIGYALLPFDLIPDFIPILGHVDDLILVPGLLFLAIRLTPAEILAECRQQAESLILTSRG